MRMVLRGWSWVAALVATLAFSPGVGRAQDGGSTGAPELADQPSALADVLRRAEEAEDQLDQVDRALEVLTSTRAATAELDALKAEIEERLARLDQRLDGSVTRSDLENALRQWSGFADEVQKLASRATDDIARLESLRGQLRALTQRWIDIRDRLLADDEIPREVTAPALAQARSILRSLTDHTRELTGRLEPLLRRQARLAELRRTVDDVLTDLRARSEIARSEILTLDAPPLWEIDPRDPSVAQHFDDAGRRVWEAFALDFWPRYRGRLPLHALLAVALLGSASAVWLRRRRRREEALSDEARLSDRPFSAALLLALAASLVFYPQMPVEVGSFIGLAALVPVLRFVTHLIGPPLDRWLWVLGGLFVLQRVYLVVGSQTWWGRILLLVAGLTTVAVFGVILRSAERRRVADRNRVIALGTVFLYVFSALTLAGAVADIFGLSSLAAVLIGGVLLASYSAVAIGALAMIAIISFRLFARSRVGSQFRSIRTHRDRVEAEVSKWVQVLAVLWWFSVALERFGVWDVVSRWGLGVLRFEVEVGSASVRLLDGVLMVFTLWASIQIAKLIRFLLEEEVLPPLPLARGVPTAISRGASYVVLAVGFLFAVAAAGIDVDQLTVVFGAFGVGIGFGLQNLVNNFVSGLILIFERPIQVGDLVEFQNQMGHVRQIGIRASVVRTFSGAELIVPNGDLVSSQVVNWNLSDRRRRVEIPVHLPFEDDPKPAIGLMVQAASEHADVIDDPEPMVCAKGFDDGATVLELWCWTADTGVTIRTKSELTLDLVSRFREAGLRMAVPRRALRWDAGPGEGEDAIAEPDET